MAAVIEAPHKVYTPEDLLTLRNGDLYELVGGQLVERNMGAESSLIGQSIGAFLWNFNCIHRLGWVLGPDTTYECFEWIPRHARRADVSFVKRSRLSRVPKGTIKIAPDFAVEVVSPKDTHSEVSAKVGEYLQAGVPLVWVVNPDTRTADVYRRGSAARLHGDDEPDGEDVLPGFRLNLRALFATAEEPKE
jgi:Uma2 family endonuclease